ncbi:MAG: twin-arginine translocase TatA/TatE family subunit [Acidobacteriota bacterium]|nr:MAG: twin-arginine translocase TatA/TatE family subunit [Acidobacteriota bacterium]
MLGTTEIILIVLAIFLLFGASRLPKLAKSLGESRRAFKEGMDQAEKEFSMEEESKQLEAEKPSVSEMSDDELAAEMQRRQASRS